MNVTQLASFKKPIIRAPVGSRLRWRHYLWCMPQISQLFIYPIKSLGGIAVPSAQVTDRGLQWDRRWMLVDGDGNFLTQRTQPQLALFAVALNGNSLAVSLHGSDPVEVPLVPAGRTLRVQVWSDRLNAVEVSPELSHWFSQKLAQPCRLVFMPDETRRPLDGRYADDGEITSLSDGYPFLLVSEASLADLNARLEAPVPVNRFRPNIVVTGCQAFAEDGWAEMQVGGVSFFGVKLCARCVVTTINQQTAAVGSEPLKTLASYRRSRNGIYFGQNLLHRGTGTLHLGDAMEVVQTKALHF